MSSNCNYKKQIIKNIHFLEFRHQAKWELTIICNLLSIFKNDVLVSDAPTNYGQFWQGLFKENKNFNWKLLLPVGLQFQILWLLTLELHLEKSKTSNIKSI
jgi:hypothetical protein